MKIIDAGSTARGEGFFNVLASESATLTVADIQCWITNRRSGEKTEITSDIVAGTPSEVTIDEVAYDLFPFYVDHAIPDDARSGKWTFRWECQDPKISFEKTFLVRAAASPEP